MERKKCMIWCMSKFLLLTACLLATSAHSSSQSASEQSASQTTTYYVLITFLLLGLILAVFRWRMTQRQLAENQALMKVQSRTDELTQMLNRKYLEKRLFELFELHMRKREVRDVLIMIDIDEFKKVNVTHGHAAGDWALQRLSQLVIERFRNTDLCGRYSEHTFLVLLRDSGVENATKIAEELREKVANTVISFKQKDIKLTCSIGLSAYSKTMVSCHDWIQQADMAAYQSKQKGGNQTTVSQPGE